MMFMFWFRMQIVVVWILLWQFQQQQLLFPNIFSPNGDGINDEFIFDKNGIKAISVEIYNRWGSLVMNWTDLDKGWDGTGSDGQDLPDAVYFYVLTAEGEDGYFYENKSSITLIR